MSIRIFGLSGSGKYNRSCLNAVVIPTAETSPLRLTKPRTLSCMKFTTSLRVRYSETDQMGVVYHGNYFAWFEMGRVELMRSLGFSYQELEAQENCVLPVVEATCRYRRPARYDDLLELETRLKTMRGPMVVFGYTLLCAGALLAEAETKHVVVDRCMQRTVLPERYRGALLEVIG